MGELLIYKGRNVGELHWYFPIPDKEKGPEAGYVTFEGLDALLEVLNAPDSNIIECGNFNKDVYGSHKIPILTFKEILQRKNLAIFLSTEQRAYYDTWCPRS